MLQVVIGTVCLAVTYFHMMAMLGAVVISAGKCREGHTPLTVTPSVYRACATHYWNALKGMRSSCINAPTLEYSLLS